MLAHTLLAIALAVPPPPKVTEPHKVEPEPVPVVEKKEDHVATALWVTFSLGILASVTTGVIAAKKNSDLSTSQRRKVGAASLTVAGVSVLGLLPAAIVFTVRKNRNRE